MNPQEVKYCWLTHSWEKFYENEADPFDITIQNIDVFESFYHLLFPEVEFCQEELFSIANPYKNDVEASFLIDDMQSSLEYNNSSIYNFKLNSPNPQYKIHSRLQKDLTRTIGKYRSDRGIIFVSSDSNNVLDLLKSTILNTSYLDNSIFEHPTLSSIQSPNNDKPDTLIESYARVLIYADKNGLSYGQGFAELLTPIYHIVFSGISGISSLPPDLLLVEGLSAQCFLNFMLKDPFNHLKYFSSFQETQEMMNILRDKVAKYEIGDLLQKENVDISYFAQRWFLLIFMQDLPLKEVIHIWSYLIENLANKDSANFHDLLIDCCLSAAVLMTNQCKGKYDSQIISTMLNISMVCSESIIKPPDQHFIKKKKRI